MWWIYLTQCSDQSSHILLADWVGIYVNKAIIIIIIIIIIYT
jgi:hypothetical protein